MYVYDSVTSDTEVWRYKRRRDFKGAAILYIYTVLNAATNEEWPPISCA